MKRCLHDIRIAAVVLAAAAFFFAASGIQTAFGDDLVAPPKTENVGKTGSSAATKAMTKQERTPKTKTMGNGAEKANVQTNGNKAKVKAGSEMKGDDVSLKKGGNVANPGNARQGFMPDKTKAGVTKDAEPKAKIDRSNVEQR